MPRHLGTHRFDGLKIGEQSIHTVLDGYGSAAASLDGYNDEAAEDLTLTIDPTSGIDPDAGTRYIRQAQITDRGSFLTIDGALNSLPPTVRNVTINIVDGTYSWSSLGDWNRFNIPTGKQMILQSSSIFTIEAGTSTYAIASTTVTQSKTTVTLAADPGFVADTYKNKWMRIVSGTGTGEYLPIRSHTTTTWEMAGTWSSAPNGTSVMEIVNPSVSITLTPVITQVNGPGINDVGSGIPPVLWKGIELIGSSLQPIDFDIRLDAFKRTNGSITSRFCYINLTNVISTGGTSGFFVNGGRIQTFVGSGAAVGILISNKSNVAVSIGTINAAYTSSIPTKGYLFHITTDTITGTGIPYKVTGASSVLSLSTIRINGTSAGNRIFQVDAGGMLQLDAGTITNGVYPVGAIADMQIDGQDVIYQDLLDDVSRVLIGEQNSIVRTQTGL